MATPNPLTQWGHHAQPGGEEALRRAREERPDLDQIYMPAVVAMTGRGGRPRSPLAGGATAFVCGRFACRLPVSDPRELADLLGG